MKDVRLVWRKHGLIRSETSLTEASNYLQHQSSLSVTVRGEQEARCGSPVCGALGGLSLSAQLENRRDRLGCSWLGDLHTLMDRSLSS